MAIGRQDYQAGVVPIKSGYSLMQTPFFKADWVAVANGADDVFCSYTVVAGYRLNVTGIRVSSIFPGIQIAAFRAADDRWMIFNYDMSVIDNFPEGSPYIVNAGEVVELEVWNATGIDTQYYGSILGYLEQLAV